MKANVLKVGGDAALLIRAITAAVDAADAVAQSVGRRRRGWDWHADPWMQRCPKIAAVGLKAFTGQIGCRGEEQAS